MSALALAEEYLRRADAFDAYARDLREEGFPLEAEEADAIAVDYRSAAAHLEDKHRYALGGGTSRRPDASDIYDRRSNP